MNKIYKSIWNHVTRTFTAVSEVKHMHGKRSCSAAVVLLSPVVMLSSALAYDSFDGKDDDRWTAFVGDIYLYSDDVQSDILHTFVIGGQDAARDYGNLDGNVGTYVLHISDKNASLDLDTWGGSLFSQSTNGHSQLLVKAENWDKGLYLQADDISVTNDNNPSATNEFRQIL